MQYIRSKCSECGKPVVRKRQSKRANVKRHFCSLSCKSAFQRRAKPVTKQWLYEQYVTNNRDCPDIGREVGRDGKSVWNWLKDFGIPTRPRGTGWRKNLKHGSGQSNAFFGHKHSDEFRAELSKIAKLQNRRPWKDGKPPRLRGSHHGNWKGGITADRQAFYSSKEWLAAARAVWKRDKSMCQRCQKRKQRGDPFDIHHIAPFSNQELRATVSNLVLLCEPCHYWVHGKSNTSRSFLK